jgi:tetratricopeptide (TPR) repeat protein
MKRLNLKLLLTLLVGVGAFAGAAFGLWTFQMHRNSQNFLVWAKDAGKKGKIEEQLNFLQRYLLYDPHDAKVLSEYALLISEVARAPESAPDRSPRPWGRLAIQACINALRENDKDTAVRQSLADLYLRVGRAQDALSHLEWLLKVKPDDTKAMKMAAQCQRVLGHDDKAEELFRAAIKLNPKDVDLYGGIAEIYQQRKDDKSKEAADKVLDEMVAANPDNWLAYMRRYQYRIASGITDEARADLERAVQLGPTQLDVLLMAADRAAIDKDFEKSRHFLEEAKKHHPRSELVYTAYSRVERYAGQFPQAAKQLEEGLKIHPNDLTMLWMLAEYRLREGDVAGTRKIVNQLEDLHLPTDRIEFLRALIMMQEKKYADAIQVLNRIRPGLANVPGFGQQIDVNRAFCYRALNQIDQEIGVLRQMLLADPLSRATRLDLARALISSGQTNEAVQELNELVEAGDDMAMRMMFQVLLSRNLALPPEQRNWAQTDRLMEEIVKRDPENVGILALHAEYLNKKGEVDQAQKLLADNREKFAKEPVYQLALADATNSRGGPEAALKLIDQAEKEIGPKQEFRLARVSLLAQKGDEASKKALLDMAAHAGDLSENDRRALLGSIGQTFYVLRDFEHARNVYAELAKQNKDDLGTQLVLYSLARDADDDAAMQAALDEIQRIAGENNSYTLFCKAARIVSEVQRKRLALDSLDQARNLADRAASQRPNWGAVWGLRGEIEERRGNVEKAIESYRKALDLGDTNPSMLRHLASLLLSKGRADELQAIVDKLPNGRALLGPRIFAVYKIQEGDIAEALPLAREAAKEDPNSYITQTWLGDVLKTGGQFDQAEEAYKRATQLAPEVPEPWLALVRLYAAQDRNADIQNVIAEMETKVKPDQRDLAIAAAREAADQQQDAEKIYLERLEKNPNDLKTLESLAAFYLRTNRTDKGVEYLNRLSRAGSQAPPDQRIYVERAHRTLADLFSATGRPENVAAAIQIIDRNANPDLTTEDKSRKAKYYALLADPNAREAAIRLLKEVLEKEPERAGDRLLLADLYDRQGRWREAKDIMLDLVTSKHKDNPLILLKYADMLLGHDETAEAVGYIERLETMKLEREPLFIGVKAHLLQQQHQPAQAIALIKSQISRPLAPSGVPVLRKAADQLVALAKDNTDAKPYLDAAEAMYREYVGEMPEETLVLARFLGQHRSLDAAFEACSQAVAQKVPVDQVAQVGLSLLRAKPAEVTDKLKALEADWLKQSLDKDPDGIGVNLLMADFQDLQGNYDEAVALYRKLKDREDLTGISEATVLNNLAFILAVRDNRGDEALPLIEKALKKVGPASELLDTRGMVQLSRGKIREALIDLENAIASAPNSIKYFHLAIAQLAANDRTAAADSFDRAQAGGLTIANVPPLEQEQFKRLQREFPNRASAARS